MFGNSDPYSQNSSRGCWGDSQIISFLLVLLAVVGDGPGPLLYAGERDKTPSNQTTTITIYRAAGVWNQYEHNEVDADKEMKNTLIGVTGDVERVGKDIRNEPYVTLSNGKEFSVFSVQCFFPRSDEGALSGLRRGDTVTIMGTCRGKFGNVLLKDCYIYDEKAEQKKEAQRKVEEKNRRSKQRAEEVEKAKWRSWTSADGKNTIHAQLVKTLGNTVYLKKDDGKIIEIQKDVLCDGDKKWIDTQGWNRKPK